MLEFGYRNSERSIRELKPKRKRLLWKRRKDSSDLQFQVKVIEGLGYVLPKGRAA
jgi:hypothetical protein